MPDLDFFPSPEDILNLELKSLNLLRNTPHLQTKYSKLTTDADNAYYQMLAVKKRLKHGFTGPLLTFESYIETSDAKKGVLGIYFGGRIEVNKIEKELKCTDVSHYLAVCRGGTEILRKIHFDYDPGFGGNATAKKPFHHIQYGGELTPIMKRDGFKDLACANIHGWLENPRISFFPVSLFSLIYLIFREFEPVYANKLFEDDAWYGHLRESERMLLLPFFKTCCTSINASQSLYHNCYYHKP